MRTAATRRMRWLAGTLVMALGARAHAQRPVQALRVLDDPSTGAHWLLVRTAAHPGGPGLLVRAERTNSVHAAAARLDIQVPPPVVIRGGDPLVVLDESGVAEASFDAVALGPAAAGKTFRARLRVTGRAVRVIALGPGRARLSALDVLGLDVRGEEQP